MKFAHFSTIRESLIQEGLINESVKSYREYAETFEKAATEKEIAAEYEGLNPFEGLDVDLFGMAAFEDTMIDEAAGDGGGVLKNIMGFMKIKGLSGKYMKSMVDEAVADMDYARRKAAAGEKGLEAADKEKLKQAYDAKKAALKDRTAAIVEKIDSIATTDFLKKVASRTKIAARIKKNEVVLKVASKEEAKELRLKNADLTKDLATLDGELKDYQKDNASKIEDAQKEAMEKIKEQIKDLQEKADKIKNEIKSLEEEYDKIGESFTFEAEGDTEVEDKAKKVEALKAKLDLYKKIAPLKKALSDVLGEIAGLQKQYNEASGKDEYSHEGTQKQSENALKDSEDYISGAKDFEEKIKKAEEEAGAEPEVNTEELDKAIEDAKAKYDEAVKAKEGAGDDEAKKAEAEKAANTAKVTWLEAKIKKATAEKDDEAVAGYQKEIEEIKSKEGEPAEKEPEEEDSEEVKKIKDKISEYESAIKELQDKKGKSKSDNEKIGVLQAALNSEKKKLEKAKGGSNESAEEPTKKKAMTFEEFRSSRK